MSHLLPMLIWMHVNDTSASLVIWRENHNMLLMNCNRATNESLQKKMACTVVQYYKL